MKFGDEGDTVDVHQGIVGVGIGVGIGTGVGGGRGRGGEGRVVQRSGHICLVGCTSFLDSIILSRYHGGLDALFSIKPTF